MSSRPILLQYESSPQISDFGETMNERRVFSLAWVGGSREAKKEGVLALTVF
jgi:hypothetical protein